jgi:hypothetical protein
VTGLILTLCGSKIQIRDVANTMARATADKAGGERGGAEFGNDLLTNF